MELSDLLEEDGFGFDFRHIVKSEGEPVGRLYTKIESIHDKGTGEGTFALSFTARTTPRGKSLSDVSSTLDMLRGEINKAFVNITTKKIT